MIKQGFIVLLASSVCLALGNNGFHSKKNGFQSQGQSKYPSVAAFHSAQPPPAPVQTAPAPQPYSFSYEAEGSARQESSDASGKVSGSYQVTNEDGSVRTVKYVADEMGFRADIDTDEPGTKSDNPADVSFKSSAVEKKYVAPAKQAAAHGYSGKANKMQYEQKPIQFSSGNAYSYSYESKLEDGGSSAQSESSDGSGKVSGHYSMSTAGGSRRKVDYSADQQGFKASVDTNEFGTRSDSPAHVQFKSSAPLAGPAAQSFGQQQKAQMYAPAFQQQPIQAEFANSKPSPYAFSYDAQLDDGSSSRQESADASGKVVGSYSLSGADGRKRTIQYEADHEGFRAKVDTNEFGTRSDSPADVAFHSSAAQQEQAPQMIQQSKVGAKSSFQAPSYAYQGQPSVQYNAAAADETYAPYAFEYSTDLEDGSISRKESADESGRVVGSYSLSVADGRKRTVDYLADKEGGFRATVNTNEFGTKADSPADVQFYSSATFDEPAPYSSPNAYKAQSSSSSASMYGASMQTQQQVDQSPIQFNMGPAQGAYSYNYEAQLGDGGSSSRSESSDGARVQGYYSLAHSDGSRRKVDYTADNEGFQAAVDTNEFGTRSDSPAHVTFLSSAPQTAPKSPAAPTAFKAPAAPTAFKAPAASSSVDMYQTNYVQQQKVEPIPYAFNYEAEASGGSSSRKESSDGSGTVTGSYQVRNEDGSLRVVEYIADHNGFRANVKTNEPGTKSDHPADVTVHSETAPAKQAPLSKARFPTRTDTPKSSMISQKRVEAWSR